MASLMSVNNNSDIAPLDDFDNEDIPEDVEEVSGKNLDEILDISAQLDLMTSSLTESELPSTPISGMFNNYIQKLYIFIFNIYIFIYLFTYNISIHIHNHIVYFTVASLSKDDITPVNDSDHIIRDVSLSGIGDSFKEKPLKDTIAVENKYIKKCLEKLILIMLKKNKFNIFNKYLLQ